jgi:hypothetical protein
VEHCFAHRIIKIEFFFGFVLHVLQNPASNLNP